jgi:small subunit ribosomal protein S8
MTSDPISDMLARIRNALKAGLPSVELPGSKIKGEILRVMKE